MANTKEERIQARKQRQVKELGDYVAELPRVRQVLGDKHLTYTLGAAGAFSEITAMTIFGAVNKMSQKKPLAFYLLGKSLWNIGKTVATLSRTIHNLSEKLSKRKFEELNEIDYQALHSLKEKGLLTQVPEIKNRLHANGTCINQNFLGKNIISMNNGYDLYSGDERANFFQPNDFGKNDWGRLLALLHEASHNEFFNDKKYFSPTPGSFLPEQDMEEKALHAINTWAISPVFHRFFSNGSPNVAARTLSENQADTLSAMILIKESKANPEAIEAIEKFRDIRRNGIEKNAEYRASNPGAYCTGLDIYEGCMGCLDKVLSMKEEILSMTGTEIRAKATEIASDELLRLARDYHDRGDLYLEGLVPQPFFNTGNLIGGCLGNDELKDVILEHPMGKLASFDLKWISERYGQIFTKKDAERLESWSMNPKIIELLNSSSLNLSLDQVARDDRTPPHGISKDIHMARLAIAREIYNDLNEAVDFGRKAIMEHKEVRKFNLSRIAPDNFSSDNGVEIRFDKEMTSSMPSSLAPGI